METIQAEVARPSIESTDLKKKDTSDGARWK